MNNQNSNSNMISMKVNELTVHPTLEELGIQSLSQFELEVNNKFGIPNEIVIINELGQVISNWEYVESCKEDTIDVCQLSIKNEELLIVLASRNLRKKLKPSGRITLERLLRHCLKETEFGKELWKNLSGKSTTEKIGKMLESSYGTIEKDFLIYKYAPQFIGEMDKGICSLESAYEYAKQVRDKINGKEEAIGTNKLPTPKKRQGEFAGDTKMIPCKPIIGITIRRYDGPPLNIDFDDSFKVESRIDPVNGTAEHHKIINLDTQTIIDLHIKNAGKL